jgi:redox-sensitive bicupin YhaK (pirin superfamily)
MITWRRATDRGHANFGWLDSRHTFSFGQYHDVAHCGFGALRVINQDVVAPGRGFPMHPHRDFEIYSWILSGALAHADTTGARATITAGGLQLISAGTGVAHEEFNPSATDPVHFLQVWLHPDRSGHRPRYLEAHFERVAREGRLCPILVPEAHHGDFGTDGALPLRQDAWVYVSLLQAGRDGPVTHSLVEGRVAWVHVARGSISLDGEIMGPGDGAAVTAQSSLTLAPAADGEGEVMVFDLAAPSRIGGASDDASDD